MDITNAYSIYRPILMMNVRVLYISKHPQLMRRPSPSIHRRPSCRRSNTYMQQMGGGCWQRVLTGNPEEQVIIDEEFHLRSFIFAERISSCLVGHFPILFAIVNGGFHIFDLQSFRRHIGIHFCIQFAKGCN